MKSGKRGRNRHSSEDRLDFTALPMEETIHILRRLGMRMLTELLAPPWYPGKALPAKTQPEFKTLLTKQEIKKLSQSRIWKLKRRFNRKAGRIPKNLKGELPLAFKKLFPKCIKGKVSSAQWQVAACNRMALALGGTRGDVLPDNFWLLAAEAAWSDPDFTISAAVKIRDWVRHMRLFFPYEFPVVVLSPITYWVLIAMAKIKPLNLFQWFSRRERAAIRIYRRLQQEAQLQMMKNQWAGFWEQWIVQLASQRWPAAFGFLERRLCKALLGLPLLKTTEASTLCKKKGKFKIYPWTLVEKWFDMIDGIKRLKRSKNEFRRIALLNFSAPDWNEQMPEFFARMKDFEEQKQRSEQNG